MKLIQYLFITVFAFLLSACSKPDYYLNSTVETVGDYSVEVTVDTNLPDGLVLGGSLSLKDQQPDDPIHRIAFD